ncbi:MAG: tetratricopeptide repeat protein [Syntrophobacteraceae bacterium]
MGKSRNFRRLRWLLCLAVLMSLAGCASAGPDAYSRAVENYSRGRIAEALSEYREAIRVNPDDPKPKFNMAVIFQDQGRVEEAESIYRAILDRNPGYAPAWSNLASVQEKRGQADAAEKSYRRALEVDRDNPWAASQFGYFYFRAGRLDEARALFEESLRRNPRCSNAWFGLAEIAEKRGDAGAAIKDYDKVILFNPSDLPAYLRAADLRIARGERDAAIGLLRRAVKVDPRRSDIHFLLGRLLREAGKWKEAEKAFDEAKDTGTPPAECDRELSFVYTKLAEEAAAGAGGERSETRK